MNTNINESRNNSIIARFMRGDLDAMMMDEIPENKYQHIKELDYTDSKTGCTFKYYYDKESDLLGCKKICESLDNMIEYKGAYIYKTSDGYEANLCGFHYAGTSIEECKEKIDTAIKTNDIEKTVALYSAQKDRAIFEDVTEGPEWEVTFYLGESDIDDSFEDNSRKIVRFNAPDFDAAKKYADQYIRKMQLDNETADEWMNATILGIELL